MTTQRLVDRFWEFHTETNSYSQAWSRLRSWSLQQASEEGKDPRQSWASASGRAFENISQGIMQQQIENSPNLLGISVTPWNDTDPKIRDGILSELVWPKGQITRPEKVESNVDMVVALFEDGRPTRVISVYSCKTSTAERYQQDLFWAEKLRARGIRFCFVTREEGLVEYATADEAPNDPNKTVVLAQALYDRIYLLTEPDIKQNPAVFRRIDMVAEDIDLWMKAY